MGFQDDIAAVGLDVLAIDLDRSRTYCERTFFLRHEHVGVGLLKGRGALAVDKRGAAAGTGVRSGEHVKICELRCPQVAAALVDRVGQLERSAHYYLFRRLRPEYHLIRKHRQGE